ncbi:protein kinase [Streptomyces sp. CAU 1734]|uniref:protein kinase domain-containing protein n=1 Tax=Streptomyces sp. CAU 1734 TaxID=3140360 RepID=UPI0032602D61
MNPDCLALPVPHGYRIGPWEVREPLASGAFATVYAARRVVPAPGMPREAALKFLPTGTRTPRQLLHLREVTERVREMIRRLRRPRLITMYETLTVDDPAEPALDGATVVVMERAASSLDTLLTRCPRPAAGPALLTEICEGLHQLHHAGWVHGDLNPGNVLLLADQSVRLGDFHLATELRSAHGYAPGFHTNDYTPPELLGAAGEREQRIDATADIWAFGVLAHLVLTGRLPFPGATPGARREAAVRYARGVGVLRLAPGLPEAWRGIVTDCLARTQVQRSEVDTAVLLRRAEAATGSEPSPVLPRRPFGHRPLTGASGAGRERSGNRGRSTSRSRYGLGWGAAAALVVAGTLMTVMVRSADTAEAAGYERCAPGHVCFFTEKDGGGEMCAWYGNERDAHSGIVACDWSEVEAPRSAVNNGSGAVPLPGAGFYQKSGYQEQVGCLQPRERANLDGETTIRSVKWLPSC